MNLDNQSLGCNDIPECFCPLLDNLVVCMMIAEILLRMTMMKRRMTGIWLQRTEWGVCLVAIQHKQVREAFIQGWSLLTVNTYYIQLYMHIMGEIMHHPQSTIANYVYSYLTIWFNWGYKLLLSLSHIAGLEELSLLKAVSAPS